MAKDKSNLEQRLRLVVDRLGFVPSRQFMQLVPYWDELLDQAEQTWQDGLQTFANQILPENYLAKEEVEIPSFEQTLVGAQIAQRKKVLELSKPGTRKTISALSAIPIIEHEYLPKINPDQQRLKTIVNCPTYIIPNWIIQIQKFLKQPQIAVVTSDNRQNAIHKAADPNTNVVIVGYDMTFRDAGIVDTTPAPVNSGNFWQQVVSNNNSNEDLYDRLVKAFNEKQAARMTKKLTVPKRIALLVQRENEIADQKTSQQVMRTLKEIALSNGVVHYSIVDEFHNIINPMSRRGQAIADIVKSSEWAALLSGTGIGNKPDGLAWAAHVLDYADNPADFIRHIREGDLVAKVGAFLDRYTVHPQRRLHDIDPAVKKPIQRDWSYEASKEEIDLFTAIVDSEQFDGRDKYRLLRYAVTNPKKLLPSAFSHLSEGDDSLQSRVQQMFDDHPGLEERIEGNGQSRIKALYELVEQIKSEGEKCIIACEYQRETTAEIEDKLKALGVLRVDQSVSPNIKQIAITGRQRAALHAAQKDTDDKFYEGTEKYLSELSEHARNLLGLAAHELYTMSDRDIIMHTFATNPDIAALVASRCLREGVEMKEAVHIIDMESTSVPAWDEQFNARTIRSGQHRQVTNWKLNDPILRVVTDYVEAQRNRKQNVIDAIEQRENATPEQMHAWLQSDTKENAFIEGLGSLNSRNILSYHFSLHEGAGSKQYAASLKATNNALFIAQLYNKKWDETYAGNVAKLTRDIVHAIEKRKDVELVDILDAGSGPLALSQTLERPTTAVDMNRYQLQFGNDACVEKNLAIGNRFLGNICDLSQIISLEETDTDVFTNREKAEKYTGLQNASQDLVCSSLVIDLLNAEDRDLFVKESYRVLKDHGYLTMVVPTSKIDMESRSTFLQALEQRGFANVEYLTGTYRETDHANNPVEAYVIVAQKRPENLSDTTIDMLLKPETRVVTPEGLDAPSKKKRKRTSEQYHSATGFVKVETQLDLYEVIAEKDDPAANLDQKAQSLEQAQQDPALTQALRELERAAQRLKGDDYE